MTNLYPIIRRKRRPLLVVKSGPDGPPASVAEGNVAPAKAAATKPVEPVVMGSKPKRDDLAAAKRESQGTI